MTRGCCNKQFILLAALAAPTVFSGCGAMARDMSDFSEFTYVPPITDVGPDTFQWDNLRTVDSPVFSGGLAIGYDKAGEIRTFLDGLLPPTLWPVSP